MRIVALRLGLLVAVLCASAGCSAAAAPWVRAGESLTVTARATLQPAAATLVYPAGGGYTATFAYGANDAPSGTTAAVTTIVNPPPNLAPMDAPPGTALVAYELTLDNNVKFNVWNGFISSIVLPQSIRTSGRWFSDYGYDLTLGVAGGSDPGTVNGSTISFPAGRFPVTLEAGHTYLMIVAMQ